MKYSFPKPAFPGGWLLAVVTTLISTPVIAQTANFAALNLSRESQPSQGKVSGYTGGSYSLSAISNRDRHKKACIGFASPTPDHIMILETDMPQLTVLVNSGKDTTLLIQGPDETTIRCGDDTGKKKDASVNDINWKKGTYRIWTGTFNPGIKTNYTLTVQQ